MTNKIKPEDRSSSKAGKDKPGGESGKEENDEYYHASSWVESDALRAIMGKKKREDNDDPEGGDKN